MAKRIDFEYRVYDNCIEIIPKGKIEDNSIYTIKLNGIKSTSRAELERTDVTVTTKMTPCYCSLYAVKMLMEDFQLPDSTLLFFIRQASRQADYIHTRSHNGNPVPLVDGKPPFVVEKYVELKATYEALTRAFIDGNNDLGMEGTLGELTFKNGDNIDNIWRKLGELKRDIKVWQEAIRGYELEGRNEPGFAMRASRTMYGTPADSILNSYNRNIAMGKDRWFR